MDVGESKPGRTVLLIKIMIISIIILDKDFI